MRQKESRERRCSEEKEVRVRGRAERVSAVVQCAESAAEKEERRQRRGDWS